jgi:hypothetical protein
MPNGQAPYTASAAFSDYFTNFRTGSGAASVSDGRHYGSSLRSRIDQFFSQDATGQTLMTPDEQYKRDVAFWYGAIQHPGDAATGNAIEHLFAALYYGGLMVRKKNDSGTRYWAVWNSLQIPIAASLSHTARVLIQLPKMADVRRDADWQNTWNTFWNAIFSHTNPRMAATHKVPSVPIRISWASIDLNMSPRKRGRTRQPRITTSTWR